MSNHKDERDIEEILASLDAMLADAHTPLPTSETPEKVSVDDDSPRQRIVLTEANLEPAAHESIPLWAVQPKVHNEQMENALQTDKVNSPSVSETTTSESVDKERREDDLDPSAAWQDTPHLPNTNEIDLAPETENSIQDIVTPHYQEESVAEINVTKDTDTLELEVTDSKPADNVEAIFEATDNPETFDISEAMNEDTLYDFEVLDHEFVKGFVQSTPHGHHCDDKVGNTEAAIEANIDIETEADESIVDDVVQSDLTINEMINSPTIEPFTEHIQTSLQQAVEQDETFTLNPDELDPIIEAISDDVRIKINHHLQQILPELISDALLEHLSAPRDDNT
ncbi:MAG: hypothetical protein Q9N67_01165 [Ghiorsea sp.]|nr:hypothetical protein [Ghiorsea sp.]